jgi:hypothetical protein
MYIKWQYKWCGNKYLFFFSIAHRKLLSGKPTYVTVIDTVYKTNVCFGHTQKLRSSLCSFLQPPVTSFLFGPNIPLNTLFSNTLSLYYKYIKLITLWYSQFMVLKGSIRTDKFEKVMAVALLLLGSPFHAGQRRITSLPERWLSV